MEMANHPVLPENILKRQVCQECFKYLSVTDTAFNKLGIICGRCLNQELNPHNSIPVDKIYTKSTYNIIAQGFLFKCINHYSGCNQVVNLAEAEKHEESCFAPEQECFFCSFSGVLSQILNHCLKLHPENVTYDGKIYIFLNNQVFQNKMIYILNDHIFLVIIDSTEEVFTVQISHITKFLSPLVNRFGVKFFKPNDPSNIDYLHSNYGMLDVSDTSYFEKRIDELISTFGPGVQLCCQIFLGQFLLERELEYKQQFDKLSGYQEKLENLKQELQSKEQQFLEQTTVCEEKLLQQNILYESAINQIKKFSLNFKCNSCQKVTLTDMYFCPKNHFYCKKCLTNICSGCDSMQVFTQLDKIDNLLVSCDWPRCEEKISILNYIGHKALCQNRSYMCPSCKVKIISLENFIEHSSACGLSIINGVLSISCEINKYIDNYWVIDGDLYHLIINFNDKIIRVLIEEFDVIQNNVMFKCHGTNSYGENIIFSNFSQKYDINMENIKAYYNNINVYFIRTTT